MDTITQLQKLGLRDEIIDDILEIAQPDRPRRAKRTKRVMPCEIWSRVVGYFRPVNQWNRGKQAEFWEREHYKTSKLKGC